MSEREMRERACDALLAHDERKEKKEEGKFSYFRNRFPFRSPASLIPRSLATSALLSLPLEIPDVGRRNFHHFWLFCRRRPQLSRLEIPRHNLMWLSNRQWRYQCGGTLWISPSPSQSRGYV